MLLSQLTFAFLQSDSENERKEQFVFFEQRSTDVVVDTGGEVFVQTCDPLFQVIRLLAILNRLRKYQQQLDQHG